MIEMEWNGMEWVISNDDVQHVWAKRIIIQIMIVIKI